MSNPKRDVSVSFSTSNIEKLCYDEKGQGTVKHLWYENCYYPGDVKIVVVAALNNLTIFQPGTKLFSKPKVLK